MAPFESSNGYLDNEFRRKLSSSQGEPELNTEDA